MRLLGRDGRHPLCESGLDPCNASGAIAVYLRTGEVKWLPATTPQGLVPALVPLRFVPLTPVALDDQPCVREGEVGTVGSDAVLGDWRQTSLSHGGPQLGLDWRQWGQSVGRRTKAVSRHNVSQTLQRPREPHWVAELLGTKIADVAIR